MSSYVHVVKQLEKVALPKSGGKKGEGSLAAKLEAINRKQALKGRNLSKEPVHLSLICANPVVRGLVGANEMEDWVNVHISRNPTLLHQLNNEG